MATPSYFSGETAGSMEDYLKTRRQQGVRQGLRTAIGAGVGATQGSQAAGKWLDEHPLTSYERDRTRFYQEAAERNKNLDLRGKIDEDIRKDSTERWMKELEASLREMEEQGRNSRHNATLEQNMTLARIQQRTAALLAEERLRQQGSQHYQDIMTQVEGDIDALKARLVENLDPAGGGGANEGPGAPLLSPEGTPMGSVPWQVLESAYKHSADDPQIGVLDSKGKEVIAADMTSTQRAAKAREIFQAKQFIQEMRDRNPSAELTTEQIAASATKQGLPLTPQQVADYDGYHISVLQQPRNMHPGLAQSLGYSADGSRGSSSASGGSSRSSRFIQENFGDLISSTDEELDSLVSEGILDEVQKREIAASREMAKKRYANAMRAVALGSTNDQEQVLAERLKIANEAAAALGISPEKAWNDFAEMTGSDWGGEYATSQSAMRSADARRRSEYMVETGPLAEDYQSKQTAGADSSGVQRVVDAGRKWRESGAESPELAYVPEIRREREASQPTATTPAAAPGSAIEATERDLTAAAEATKQQQESGLVSWYGEIMPADSIPATTGGKVDRLLADIEAYPDKPHLQQVKADMMASPQFKQWQEDRGYLGEPDDWMFREFTREYKYNKRQNRAQNERIRALNRRNGITAAKEAGEMEGGFGEDVNTGNVAGSARASAANFRARAKYANEQDKAERQGRREERKESRVEPTSTARPDPLAEAAIAGAPRKVPPSLAERIRARRGE